MMYYSEQRRLDCYLAVYIVKNMRHIRHYSERGHSAKSVLLLLVYFYANTFTNSNNNNTVILLLLLK